MNNIEYNFIPIFCIFLALVYIFLQIPKTYTKIVEPKIIEKEVIKEVPIRDEWFPVTDWIEIKYFRPEQYKYFRHYGKYIQFEPKIIISHDHPIDASKE